MRIRLAAFGLLVATLSGCASVREPIASAVAPSIQSPSSGLVAEGTLTDPGGDLTDGQGNPVGSPSYMDLRELHAVADGTNLVLTLRLASALPVAPSPAVELRAFDVVLHTDADAVAERDDVRPLIGYTVALFTPAAGGYEPGLLDATSGDPNKSSGTRFPGTMTLSGGTITWTIPLAAIGDPHLIRLGVVARSGFGDPLASGRRTQTEDILPDDGSSMVRPWLVLGP